MNNFTENQTTRMDARQLQFTVYSVSVPILLAYATLAFMVNVGVLSTVPWIKNKLNPTLRLTISLTLSDVWTSATVSVALVYNSYLYHVHHISTNACVAVTVEVFRMGGFFSGIFHLLALALNHYVSTAHPFFARKLMTPSTTNGMIVFMWLLPTIVVLIGFHSVPDQGYRSPANISCQNLSFAHTFEYRMIILSLICILLIIMSVLYIAVIVILRRMKRKFDRTRKFSIHNQQQQQFKRKRKTFVTTLLIWLTFFLGWFPTCLMFVLMCRNCLYSFYNRDSAKVVYMFGILGNFFILTKTLANPIIYAIRIPEIKTVLRRWGLWCRKDKRRSKVEVDTTKYHQRSTTIVENKETCGLIENNNRP